MKLLSSLPSSDGGDPVHPRADAGQPSESRTMDIVVLLIGAIFFVLCAAYAAVCDRL